MALTNWPPAPETYPAWPPTEIHAAGVTCSDWAALVSLIAERGFTHAAPTGQETNLFFRDARCGDGHAVIGRMMVSPDGTKRWPFAVCNNSSDRELLVLWPPYTCGWKSGPVSF